MEQKIKIKPYLNDMAYQNFIRGLLYYSAFANITENLLSAEVLFLLNVKIENIEILIKTFGLKSRSG